jgi:hypothetical protein
MCTIVISIQGQFSKLEAILTNHNASITTVNGETKEVTAKVPSGVASSEVICDLRNAGFKPEVQKPNREPR